MFVERRAKNAQHSKPKAAEQSAQRTILALKNRKISFGKAKPRRQVVLAVGLHEDDNEQGGDSGTVGTVVRGRALQFRSWLPGNASASEFVAVA